jgi:hypothetical protein
MNEPPHNWLIITIMAAFFIIFEALYVFLLHALNRYLDHHINTLTSHSSEAQLDPLR